MSERVRGLGKSAAYECRCGAVCFRPLRRPPRDCGRCKARLEDAPRSVIDPAVSERNGDYVGRAVG